MNCRDRAQTLRALPLTSILALCGARLDPHDPRKWHTPQGVLTVTGAKFMNWNLGQGGGGAIDLVSICSNWASARPWNGLNLIVRQSRPYQSRLRHRRRWRCRSQTGNTCMKSVDT